MDLNRYGILINQYVQENFPQQHKELLVSGELEKRIVERQNEVMEYRKTIEENLEKNFAKMGVTNTNEKRNIIEKRLEKIMYLPL